MKAPMVLVTVSVFLLFSSVAAAQTVSVYPSSQDVMILDMEDFSIDIRISGVSGLYGFQFDVLHNPGIIDFDLMEDGDFLSEGGTVDVYCTSADTSVDGEIRNYACTRQGVGTGASGDGTLATINLTATYGGTSYLNISNLKLSDVNSQPISSSVANGTAEIKFCLEDETRDCGPDNETGECEYGTMTCSGGLWGACTGAVYGSDEICDGIDNDCNDETDELWPELGESCTVGIGACENTGTYICDTGTSTKCDAIPGDPGTETCPPDGIDNDCDGQDLLCLGDTKGDDCVDIQDLSLVGSHFGEGSSDTGWDPDADLNSDGEIDIFDLVLVGANFGNEYSSGACG
jgi:hypothetical protein